MKHLVYTILMICLTAVVIQAKEKKQESITILKSKITSVGLFKNGFALIKREININKAGQFYIKNIPNLVHGSLWINSDLEFKIKNVEIEQEESINSVLSKNYPDNLTGRQVVIHFKREGIPAIQGTVIKVKNKKLKKNPPQVNRPSFYYNANITTPSKQILIIEGEKGFSYVDLNMIAYVQTIGKNTNSQKQTIKKRMLQLNIAKVKKPSKIEIMYLSKGITWAPSYLLDLSNEKVLSISQKAVIKNNLEDLFGVEVKLISGFPNIKFSHATSLLTSTTVDSYMNQLNQNGNRSQWQGLSQVVGNAYAPNRSQSTTKSAAGKSDIDLHFFKAGKFDLKFGEASSFSLGKKKSPYERIVEWSIPDIRDADGNYVNEYTREQNPEKYNGSVWDAIRFENPFKRPMTTGPIMITQNGNFNGQTISHWTEPGEKNNVRITKALSVRTNHTEQQEENNSVIIRWGGRKYRKTGIKGKLFICNHRGKPIKILINRNFSGELISSDDNPTKSLYDHGAYSINKRQRLTWEITLKPGEEKTVNYRYTVLVSH